MTTETFSLRSPADGTSLAGYQWSPEGGSDGVVGIVQIVHGTAEHAGRYDRLAGTLTGAGWGVVAHDHRGHGRSAATEDDLGHIADSGGWPLLLRDGYAVTHWIRAAHPGLPLVLLGHSMGSALARLFAGQYGQLLAGLALSGPPADAGVVGTAALALARAEARIRGPRTRSALLDGLVFGGYQRGISPDERRTATDWLSRDPAEVDAYIADPQCGVRGTSAYFADLISVVSASWAPEATRGIPADLPVLIQAGVADPVGDYGKAVDQLLTQLERAGLVDVTAYRYPGARHEIFNETDRTEVTADLVAWLARHGSAGCRGRHQTNHQPEPKQE